MSEATRELQELVQRGYRFALSLTHDEGRADDLLQDAWFAVLRAGGPWSRGYLFQTIRNRFIDLCRRERRVAFEVLCETNEPVCERDALADLPLELSNGALSAALGRLRPDERATLFLAFVEGQTAQEIADALGRPRGTVLSTLHRAKQKVRAAMEGGCGGSDRLETGPTGGGPTQDRLKTGPTGGGPTEGGPKDVEGRGEAQA